MKPLPRLPQGTVDFHTHILPHMDHGSWNTEIAKAQWSLLCEAGLSAVVASSHFYAHSEVSVADYIARRDAAARRLLSAVGEGGPQLYLGAEVLVFPGLEDLPELPSLCIAGTNLLLLEMPRGGWTRAYASTVHALPLHGIRPIFAHIDRYSLAAIEDLCEGEQYLYQVNADSLCGYGKRPAFFRSLAEEGRIAAIGSDLHGAHRRSYKASLRGFLRLGETLLSINEGTAALLRDATPFTL